MFFSKPTLVALLHSATVLGATHRVIVGANNGLTFTPTTVNAAVGDKVKFVFVSQNHTATAGNPNQGCVPSGKFNSGFVPVAKGAQAPFPVFSVDVTDTNPVTVYCAQAVHCQAGMVMVINPTQAGATSLAAYQRLSAAAKVNTVPKGGVTGGRLCSGPGSGKAKAAGAAAAGAAGANAGASKAAAAGGANAGAAAAGGPVGGCTGKAAAAKNAKRQEEYEDDVEDAEDADDESDDE